MYIASNISYFYHKKAILDAVNVKLQAGKLTALLGPNGAGKSTLLKILSGRQKPQKGIVLLDEQMLHTYPEAQLALKRAVLPQQSHVQFPYTVKEIVMMGCVAHPSTKKEQEKLALQKLEEVGFQYDVNRSYLNLSGGEQQRVQLARVLAQVSSTTAGNKYLLLDEPTSSLDIAREQQLMQIVQKLCQQGIGVLAIIHDLNLAIQYADEFIFMKNGQVIYQGDRKQAIQQAIIEEVYEYPIQIIQESPQKRPIVIPLARNAKINQDLVLNEQITL